MQIKCYWVKQYNLDILDQISPKVHFQSKTGQLNITIEFIILELIQVTNFILFFFGQIYPKSLLFTQNRKSEHHHQIQHIRFNLSNKLRL